MQYRKTRANTYTIKNNWVN